MSGKGLSHIDAGGNAHMVDITDKSVTNRVAVATGRICARPGTITLLKEGKTPKGDVLAAARIAAIQAVKKTSELIPLCHPLPVSGVSCDLSVETACIDVSVRVKTTGRTGVEMEALTGCSVALLTLYDMLKAVDKSMTIEAVSLQEKTGGKSGDYKREQPSP